MKKKLLIFLLVVIILIINNITLFSQDTSDGDINNFIEDLIKEAQTKRHLQITDIQEPVIFFIKKSGSENWDEYHGITLPFIDITSLENSKTIILIYEEEIFYSNIQWDDGTVGKAYSKSWNIDIIDIVQRKYIVKGLKYTNSPRDAVVGRGNYYSSAPINSLRNYLTDNAKHLFEGLIFTGHDGGVYSVAFSPDGKTIASGSWDKTIKLWEVSTGKLIKTLTGHNSYVHSVAFSPDGKSIASGSGDKTIMLWLIE